MTTREIIEGITKWTEENICSKLTFKVPDDDVNDGRYTARRVAPAAFPLFIPAKDRLPPNVEAPIPSIAVELMSGSDSEGLRKMKIRLCLSVWSPGTHPGETFYPKDDERAPLGISYHTNGEGESYQRNGDGWEELYNFQDVALSELHGAGYIAGATIDTEDPIEYGPFTQDGTIWDYYPYWFSWVSFTVICGVPYNKNEEIRKYL